MYCHSAFHAHPTPSSQRRSLVPAVVDKAQGYKASPGPTITMRHSKIRDKDIHFRYFTSCASHILSPPSKTPRWNFEPEDLYLHWQGPSTVKAWIWERNSGGGESGGAWCPIQSGYPQLRLPEHRFHVLKSTRPTWIMKSTWQKQYRRGEGVV